jgi:hypothetical protein
MPRFGTKSLLIAFAVAAVWLSTFSGCWAAQDVRRSILLLILIASGFLAIYGRGRRRAFWSAFAVVMLLCGGLSYDRLLYRYVPDFLWMETFVTMNPPAISGYNPLPAAPAPVTPPATTPAPTPSAQDQLVLPSPLGTAPAIPPTASPYFQQSSSGPPGLTIREALNETFAAAWTITLAAAAGFIAAYIFTQQAKNSGESR